MLTNLPSINALLNATSACLLLLGWAFIRGRQARAHRFCMTAALGLSVLFLISYLIYHFQVGSVRFQGQGWIRPVYFGILISHTVLAAIVPVLAILVFRKAARKEFKAHARLARWTLPVWLYVSVTGVVIYLLLYRFYPAAGALKAG